MKFDSTISKFLTNKWVLNVVAFLALFNVIGYLVIGNINAVVYFVIFALLVRYFSKNMTIVLGVPLIIVNLLALKGNIQEGLENNDNTKINDLKSNTNEKTTPNPNTAEKKDDQNKIDDLVKKNDNKTTNVINNSAAATTPSDSTDTSDNAAQTQDGFEAGRRKNRGYNIDYASTIEDAYDELNNILGSDGIQRLTSDTQNLMKQQMQLAEAMKSMGPMMKSLSPMVEQLKGMMGEEGMGSMMDLAKKFTSQVAPAK